MKKLAFVGAVVAAASLVFTATAAHAVCANQAIWTFDGDTGAVKKWSTEGDLLDTVSSSIDSPDVAISSNLASFLAFDNGDGELKYYNATTGELESSHAITGSSSYEGSGAGAGVIAGNKILVDSGNLIISIDLSTYVGTDFADLDDADASVDAGLRGGSWSVAGDLLQLPDGDVLAVANNSTVSEDVILVRIDPASPSTPTVVGTVNVGEEVWGAARAGDDIYLATAGGVLLKLESIPSAASITEVTTTEIVTGGGSFWGAAGSNDSTEGNATCELAETGVDAGSFGLFATALIGAGGIAVSVRRRNA